MKRLLSWALAPGPAESGGMDGIRRLVRILLIMAREWRTAQVPLRASALTLSIVLSMVPMLAMGTAVLKGLGSDNQLKIAAYRLIDQFAPEGHEQGSASPHRQSEETDGRPGPPVLLEDHLRNGVDMVFAYVDKTNFATLGAFGILGLLVVVIHMLSTVEDAMNVIWHARQGRNLLRKIMDYVALLILLPISINVALAADAILHSPSIMDHLHGLFPVPWLLRSGLKLLPYAAITLSLMVMYLFFPNTRVKRSAALAGALFAAGGWFFVQRIYLILQIGVAKYNAIYGSFATVPLFLIWLQLGWIFILLGGVLAYAIQHGDHILRERFSASPRHMLELCFLVLQSVYENFSQGVITTHESLEREHPGLHPDELRSAIGKLVDGKLLLRVSGEPAGLVPVIDKTHFEPSKVVRLILGSEQPESPAGMLAEQIVRQAEAACSGVDFPLSLPTTTQPTGSRRYDAKEQAADSQDPR